MVQVMVIMSVSITLIYLYEVLKRNQETIHQQIFLTAFSRIVFQMYNFYFCVPFYTFQKIKSMKTNLKFYDVIK